MNRSARNLAGAAVPFAVAVALVVLWSLGTALAADNGLPVSARLADWARNHHLGAAVDIAETWLFRSPPPDRPAAELDVAHPRAEPPQREANPTAIAPADLEAVHRPALPGEGAWRSAGMSGGRPVVWITGIRPNRDNASMTATHVVVDQSGTRAVLHNGTEIPGGHRWIHGDRIDSVELSSALFAFNGGFRREHAAGGYFTEGREVWPLVAGAASLAIDAHGRIHIGRWGTDLDPAGADGQHWVSVRQNLQLMVIDGKLSPNLKKGYWGGSGKGEIYILRSGVCIRFDGMLMFTIMGKTNATALARAMRDAGCRWAMQLDQNEAYPRGYLFDRGTPRPIDTRMSGRDDDFISGYPRDFVVLMAGPLATGVFEPPAPSVAHIIP